MDFEKFDFYQKLKHLPFIDKIILYGSRARNDYAERSDIDLAIYCPRATPNDWINVIQIIEDADTLLKIDCIRLDELLVNNPLYHSIISEGIVLFDRTST